MVSSVVGAVCVETVDLLLGSLDIASSCTVSVIPVKVSRAGSYAMEDLRRVGMVFVDYDGNDRCGSIN